MEKGIHAEVIALLIGCVLKGGGGATAPCMYVLQLSGLAKVRRGQKKHVLRSD